MGQCAPRRLKIDCPTATEVPIPEVPGINDCEDEVTIEMTPDLVPAFRLIATIFDTDCEPILDHNNEPITGPTY